MTSGTNDPRPVLSEDELEARMVEIEKGQQLGGHFPDADALGRARRILIGEISLDEAHAEIITKYAE